MTQLQKTTKGCGLDPVVKVAGMPADEMQCDICSELFERSEIDKETDCCEDCIAENFSTCEECDTVTPDTDMQCGEGRLQHNYYCDSCFDDLHFLCASCGDTFENSYLVDNESGESFCETCYTEVYFSCEICEEETDIDRCYSTDEGMYCEECAPSSDQEPKPRWQGCDEFDKIGSKRKFGVELESFDDAKYTDWIHDTDWGAKPDGSTRGMEFVSPPMWGNDGYDNVMDFCEQATNDGVRANDDCGFHLHIDLSDTNSEKRKALALAYHYTQELWADFIVKDRRDTYYAAYSSGSRHNCGDSWDEKSILDGSEHPKGTPRYLWVNWGAYEKFGTVEIRSHEPTFDGTTVINWIKAHTLFVDFVINLSVGEVTRIFKNSDILTKIFREMWPTDLADHYIGKMHLSAMET